MKSDYRFAVLGCGNGGMALAGAIASKGYAVNVFDALPPTEGFLKFANEKEIFLEGSVNSRGIVNTVTNDMKTAVGDAEVIIIVVPAFAHEVIFEKLIPHLKDGHKIIVIPGNFGSLLLRKMMAANGTERDISISECASLPYACRKVSYNTVEIYKQKNKLKLATWPTGVNGEIINILNQIAGIFFPGNNVLEASMDNINCVLHPLPVLLNIGAIERDSKNFRHYIDGISPLISEKIHDMDNERLEIGKCYSLNLIPVLAQLKMYYGENDSRNVLEYVNSDQSPYKNLYGQNVNGRYLTEDIPYLVTPTMLLGEKALMDTPLFDICIHLASQLHNTNYLKNGTNLKKLGIDHMSCDQLLQYVM